MNIKRFIKPRKHTIVLAEPTWKKVEQLSTETGFTASAIINFVLDETLQGNPKIVLEIKQKEGKKNGKI